MTLAPIVLFVYNRPWHTRQTLEALSKNVLADQSQLFVYADGPGVNVSSEEIEKISEVREIVKEKQWCKEVILIESDNNKGLARSVIDGVTEIVNRYGKIIVLEDDLLTSPFFLNFINDGLDQYKNISNVYAINGFMFPIDYSTIETVLLPYTSTWGWGTWKDKWIAFNVNKKSIQSLINGNSFLKSRFNLANYEYVPMFNLKNKSWGIYWYFSVFEKNGLCLSPTRSLVMNIGFDGSGENHNRVDEGFLTQSLFKEKINIDIMDEINLEFFSKYLSYFEKKNKKLIVRIYEKAIKKLGL